MNQTSETGHVDITVVVPIFNMGQYLPRFLDSILCQTFTKFEVILVDDGSKDESAAICDDILEKYPERFRCIHQENRGLSASRNKGIELARGKYIIFPDPDDWVERNYLENLYSTMSSGNAKLAIVGYQNQFGKKNVLSEMPDIIGIYAAVKVFDLIFQHDRINGYAWNKLYEVEIIRGNKLKFQNNKGTLEDYEFLINYLARIDYVSINTRFVDYHYCQHGTSATANISVSTALENVVVLMYSRQYYFNSIFQEELEMRIVDNAINAIFCSKSYNVSEVYQLHHIIISHFWNYFFSSRRNIKRKTKLIVARQLLVIKKLGWR